MARWSRECNSQKKKGAGVIERVGKASGKKSRHLDFVLRTIEKGTGMPGFGSGRLTLAVVRKAGEED